jgi:hypothetical protein
MSKDNSSNGSTVKKAIEPITFVIELTADRVNENGTFSGIKIGSIKSTVKDLSGHLRVSCPPMGGGKMFLITDTLKGVKVLGEIGTAKPEKKKLF